MVIVPESLIFLSVPVSACADTPVARLNATTPSATLGNNFMQPSDIEKCFGLPIGDPLFRTPRPPGSACRRMGARLVAQVYRLPRGMSNLAVCPTAAGNGQW